MCLQPTVADRLVLKDSWDLDSAGPNNAVWIRVS